MIHELSFCFLEVVLTPQKTFTNEGGMVRCVVNRNPSWYRKFCENHSTVRSKPRKKSKSDTCIKRANVVRILESLHRTGKTASPYGDEILRIAEQVGKDIATHEADPF